MSSTKNLSPICMLIKDIYHSWLLQRVGPTTANKSSLCIPKLKDDVKPYKNENNHLKIRTKLADSLKDK